MTYVNIMVCDKCGAKAVWLEGHAPFVRAKLTLEGGKQDKTFEAVLCHVCVSPLLIFPEEQRKLVIAKNAAGEVATAIALAAERTPVKRRRGLT